MRYIRIQFFAFGKNHSITSTARNCNSYVKKFPFYKSERKREREKRKKNVIPQMVVPIFRIANTELLTFINDLCVPLSQYTQTLYFDSIVTTWFTVVVSSGVCVFVFFFLLFRRMNIITVSEIISAQQQIREYFLQQQHLQPTRTTTKNRDKH